jgi:predicted lipid-binding transport protein (Tim44 family)
VGDGRPKKRRETIMDNFEITTSPKAQNDNGVPRGRFPRRVVGGVAAALVIGVLSMSAAQARGFGGAASAAAWRSACRRCWRR